jgi:hypothetical protein
MSDRKEGETIKEYEKRKNQPSNSLCCKCESVYYPGIKCRICKQLICEKCMQLGRVCFCNAHNASIYYDEGILSPFEYMKNKLID